ncbi:MAG: sigma-54-dependent Fis family transcriptional regulator [Acidobacteria bacterium]|nr:sigma-54-dependent Fis family transcriptional regulator [Acidobacteriota bacterium]
MSSENPARALIADDQADVRTALRLLLRDEGFEVTEAATPDDVQELVRIQEFDVALVDLNFTRGATSGDEGIDLLRWLGSVDDTLPVIVMTAWGTVPLAVEAMRRGAKDFVQKPWQGSRLVALLRTHAELARAVRSGRRLEAENRLLREAGLPDIVSESPAMLRVLDLVHRTAPTEANVLILGESGTGKGVVARMLHALSRRCREPFITVNVGAVPESLFEAEFFGHTRGAFTGAAEMRLGRFDLADGGTLFLDEIATASPAAQAKLLRVLETGEFEPVGSSRTRGVDVRIMAASNSDMVKEVSAGRFREDLLYRLNVVEIRLPPLRQRPEDIPVLAHLFLERFARRHHRQHLGFSPEALEQLATYSWPGNVRELEHVVERAVILAPNDRIRPSDFWLPAEPAGKTEGVGLHATERQLIARALARTRGNIAEAARQLGLSRQALYRRMQKHGLERP